MTVSTADGAGEGDPGNRRSSSVPASPAVGPTPEPPPFVSCPAGGGYRGLPPTTKLAIAVAEAVVAFGLRGWTGPMVVLALVGATAWVTGTGRRLVPFVLATIPLVASIALVDAFLYPGARDPILVLGPVSPTWTGLAAGLQATLRVVAFALSVAVFSLTTTTHDLLSDLEGRGVHRRVVFVIGAAVSMVPRMVERAGEIVEAQRARGLDTEGSLWRRARGVLPLAGPMITGALVEVEERTMALEARAFSAPGRRTALRPLADRPGTTLLRWGALAGALVAVAAQGAGWLRLP
jgi:energy-coupling factor transport system permease protein